MDQKTQDGRLGVQWGDDRGSEQVMAEEIEKENELQRC